MPGKGYGPKASNVRRRKRPGRVATPPKSSGTVIMRARRSDAACYSCGEPILAGTLIVNATHPPDDDGFARVLYVHSQADGACLRLFLERASTPADAVAVILARQARRRAAHPDGAPVAPVGGF